MLHGLNKELMDVRTDLMNNMGSEPSNGREPPLEASHDP